MKTLIITLSCCRYGEPTVLADWQPFINALPAICGGILVLIFMYFVIRYVIAPLIANCHERQMKEDANTREKDWADFKKTKESTDEALKKQVEELKTKAAELEGNLKTEKYNKELLEKQLKMYCDIFEKLKVEVKPKEKK